MKAFGLWKCSKLRKNKKIGQLRQYQTLGWNLQCKKKNAIKDINGSIEKSGMIVD